MSETPEPERPADEAPSGAAKELQQEDKQEDLEEAPSRDPDDDTLEDAKGG